MRVQKFFHLDCSPIIPECGYQCDKCVQEIISVLSGTGGVLEVSTSKSGKISGIVVQYDSEKTAEEKLMNAFGRLPSFYRGRFVPKVLDVQ
jgi:copper chaperone CopZ